LTVHTASVAIDPKLRFGIGNLDGSPGGSYWTLKASAREQDVYVAGTSPRFMHVSLHRDGNWHAKINRSEGRPEHVHHSRPEPLAPGMTRALLLSAHGSWGSFGEPVIDRPVASAIPPPGDALVCFNVFLEEYGADLSGWPGKTKMNTKLLGRLPLARGGTVSVVANCEQSVDQTFTGHHNWSPEEATRIRDSIRNAGDPRMVLYGATDDGALALRFGRIQVNESSPAPTGSEVADDE
jgi:hypothetical protein